MEAGTEAPRRVGQLRLTHGATVPPKAGVFDVDLAPAGPRAEEWQRAGGLLALQAIAPAAGLPATMRARLSVLAVGPAAALVGYVALRLGAKRVELVLHPEDREAFEALAGDDLARAGIHRRLDEVPNGAFHDLASFGCDGAVPALDQCEPLVRRLRPEGQLLLYGLPSDMLEPVFDDLARRGLSLRAMGIADGLAFLSGSLEGGSLS